MGKGIKNKSQPFELADIEIAIGALDTYIDDPAVRPLVDALTALKAAPDDASLQQAVTDAFEKLGILQGAALTYAPYLNIFMSDDPFGG